MEPSPAREDPNAPARRSSSSRGCRITGAPAEETMETLVPAAPARSGGMSVTTADDGVGSSVALDRHRAAVRARLLSVGAVRSGPGTVSWKINREIIVVAGWGRAILLQLAH